MATVPLLRLSMFVEDIVDAYVEYDEQWPSRFRNFRVVRKLCTARDDVTRLAFSVGLADLLRWIFVRHAGRNQGGKVRVLAHWC